MGAWIALEVAVEDRRVGALALTGAFADTRALIERQNGGAFAFLRRAPALFTAKIHGMRYDERRPVDLIGRLAPRPVLVIAGDADTVVPPAMSRRLFEAANEP